MGADALYSRRNRRNSAIHGSGPCPQRACHWGTQDFCPVDPSLPVLRRMNWIDIACLSIVGLSAVVGAVRGFSREVLGIAAWAMAGVLSLSWHGFLIPYAAQWIHTPLLARAAALGIMFIALLVVFITTAHLSGQAVRGSVLGGIDRALGLLFGVLRGYACLLALYMAVSFLMPQDAWPDAMNDSRIVPLIGDSTTYLSHFTSDSITPHLAQPARTRHDAPI
ncbi:CvpA family protein [Novacetimonas hansenii]|uniref:CvpA family protein n=1 Tax=Novacetimonas hansenii TaxID=436 RepID=UPI001CE06E00|nr:CvpA family protein [Novacetimonas hansenii]